MNILSSIKKQPLIIFFLCFLFANCKKLEKPSKIFFYDVYSSTNQVVAYYRISSFYQNEIRIDSITRLDLHGNTEDEKVERFLVKKDTLFKIDFSNNKQPYLVVDLEQCTELESTWEIKTCLIDNSGYLIFTEQSLVVDGVTKKLTYDREFNLIENEYLDGYLSSYKISKRDTKPDSLSVTDVSDTFHR